MRRGMGMDNRGGEGGEDNSCDDHKGRGSLNILVISINIHCLIVP